ncbi:binding-protein-dependent transport systems inner membrane component [Rubrobacter xylanophilus DSM 9941]|uniref:Binding-protein-dependent transport systems inner membrane component n=1 Tax=Rubrobacter xylanophilus (strain DSM 9941 / JCM 11954 / NBRC 16129 / PRD-1) TaxID=266117 RepID=Q1AXC9_RUBXD|nr:ABC transporter permease [Rubrobacter xylanophilus]ABG03949.1 binding-protein-dependent transport systems inner membrane component [Rubrobacter xylanophilus DSM 9941]
MEGILQVFLRPQFPGLLLTHVELSALAVALATLVALPVALAVRNSPLGTAIAVNAGNVGRAVPSLALLALALPFLGFGFAPSLVALTALAVPPILINATTGLREVSGEVVDAARGMGLSEAQILRDIQLPMAAPVVFAGVRTSAVQVVASATLATFIGGGGLGNLIVEGFQRGDEAILLAGAISVAALAVATEALFGALERALTPKGLRLARRRRTK